MEFVAKTVESPRGLTQEKALVELQEHPEYKPGSKIASIRRRRDRWVIRLLEPKVAAEFPPSDDEEESETPDETPEEKPEEADSSEESGDEEKDSPAPPKPEKKDDKEPKGELGEVLDLLNKIVDALGINGPELGDPEELPTPDGPPLPPPPPVEDEPSGHGGPRPGAGRPPGSGGPKAPRDIPPGASPISGFASVQEMAKQVPTFTASAEDEGQTIKEAKADLEAQYGPSYKVKQVQRKEGKLHALLSVR